MSDITEKKPPGSETAEHAFGHKDTPERLIQAGIELFSKHGFEGTSVKQISEHAGVNISLVSYHFKGKEGLYRACFEHYGQKKSAGPMRVLQPVASKEELRIRLNLFLDEFWGNHLEDRDMMCLIHREEETGFKMAHDIFRKLFVRIYEQFIAILEDAQKKGILRKDLDPELVGNVFFGSMVHSVAKDHISEQFFGKTLKDLEYRKKLAHALVTTVLEGCLSE
jgi:AcrR family transcriptional regulator